MSKTEDEPEIMLEVCVDSVESAKAYVAFSRCFWIHCKYHSIPRLMPLQRCRWRCPTFGTVRIVSLWGRRHSKYGTRQGGQARVP